LKNLEATGRSLQDTREQTEFTFRNAQLVLPDEVIKGDLHVIDGLIQSIDTDNVTRSSRSAVKEKSDRQLRQEDLAGDYLLPGLVEVHTDNLERHFAPRPGTYWPDYLAAAAAHDREIAGSGITTVYDALGVGVYDRKDKVRKNLLSHMLNAIEVGVTKGVFRSEHRLHLRCELTDPDLPTKLSYLPPTPLLGLVSVMDHTPGQRQWRDLETLRHFLRRSAKSPEQIESAIQNRIETGSRHVEYNRRAVFEHFAKFDNIAYASHDDTTVEHINQARADGITIAEFPCTLEAAKAAVDADMFTIGGAPNIVRGQSHSGNVAMSRLVAHRALTALSSDYAPASLLQAAFTLVYDEMLTLPQAIGLVTANPANLCALTDRGQLVPGLRADLVRVSLVERTPIVRATYREGQRVA